MLETFAASRDGFRWDLEYDTRPQAVDFAPGDLSMAPGDVFFVGRLAGKVVTDVVMYKAPA